MAGSSIQLDKIQVDPAVRALLPNYMRRRRSDVSAIGELLEQQDFTEVARLGHNMCGSGTAYGLPFITELGRYIEAAAHQKDTQQLLQLQQQLAQFVQQMTE